MKTDTSNKIRSFLHKVPPSHETYCVMKLHWFFLLIYLGTFCVGSAAFRNPTCARRDMCNPEPDATSHFLQCAGLPPTDSGRDHMHRLKRILEGTMDIYTFMKSSLNGVPLLSLEGELELNGRADPLQNEALVQMWLEIKMKPLLKSITKHFLSCLSTKNFSCSTYQTVIKELGQHYSEMNPAQQKWIYTFFMYPFLSGDGIYGCADPEESSEEWLMKNFGAFRAMARMKDFSALNMIFSGVEVLHLLSPAQKAELLMRPEVESFENGTLSLIFHSLLTGGSEPTPTARPGGDHSWTTPAESSTLPSYPTQPTHQSHHPSPREKLRKILNGVMTAVKPIGSFVHDFISFTRQRNVSDIRSTTMTQFLLNWTLAELADMFHPKDKVPKEPQFDVTNVGDWYQQVVIPVLQRFSTNNEILEHQSIKLAFHQLFYLDNPADNEFSENPEIADVCSITLDKTHCGLTDAVENVAHVLHCAARTNLTLNEETIMRLILELTKRLNSLIKELSNTNFKEVSSEIKEIFGEGEAPSLTQEHLNDPNFIQLWFQIKLLPLLPDVHPDLLSCLSTKNFSCPVYQSLVSALGEYMSFMDADPIYSQNIYKYFIYSFLQQHNFSDSHCSANNSAEWLEKNVGFFSKFASIIDFYDLNPNFSGLEALHLLTPNQTAEMLLLPLRTPPEKDVVINYVLNYLIESPEDRKLLEVLHFVIQLAQKINPPCSIYTLLVNQLYTVIPSLSPDLEPVVWALISDLINIVPEDCKTKDMMCPQTQVNGTHICKDIDSSDLEFYISMSTHVPCNFTLEKYACAQLENFAANQLASLLRCDLPRNSSRSRVLWKLLLTKLSNVLDPALDLLADMSVVSPSAPEILDVIGEMRLLLLSDEQLMDSNVIKLWFSERLSGFLPSASEMFLLCLSSRNLSCQSYHQIVQVFSRQFRDMTFQQQHTVLKDFILRFLSEALTGPGCVSSSNSSAQWLRDNLGSFSELLSVREMFDLNPQFNPLEALSVLSPKQSAELLVLKHPTLPNTDVIINKLFDYFTESPRERKFTEFLSFLVVFMEMGNFSCASYKTLFSRFDNTSATSSLELASSIMDTKVALFNLIPTDCIIYSGKCNFITTNETAICNGVNSTELQLQLDSGKMSGRFCDVPVEELACASLSGLTASDLAEMLQCDRSSSSSVSPEIFKLLLVKSTRVLDEALDLLPSTIFDPSSPSVSVILDSIREIRLDLFNTDALNNPFMLQLWFNRRLHPFLPAVSTDFLSCLATKELQCSSYQFILKSLSQVWEKMTSENRSSVYTNLIKIFLTRNDTAGCVSSSNSSAQWLRDNLGSFSELLSVREMFDLNPQFNPMEALSVLSPKQSAELLVLKHPSLPNTDVVINKLFDYFTESPRERKFTEFLSFLVVFLEMGNLSCSSYKTLFTRLDYAAATSFLDVSSAITNNKYGLSKNIPSGCAIYSGECNTITANQSDICNGVNSTALQLQLSSGKMSGHFCDISVEEIACASVSALTAQDLVETMKCDRPSSSSGSTEVWKLLLSEASWVLDEALDLLANSTINPDSPSASMILDSIQEIRLNLLSNNTLNDPSTLQLWFNSRLRPFLPAVSSNFLSCLAAKDLQCSSYQNILQILSQVQPQMSLFKQVPVYTHFIKIYLSRNDTTDPGCSLHFNTSTEWLQKNVGGFSVLLSIRDIQELYPQFSPMEALSVLSVRQLAEVASTPGQLTSADQVTMLMNYVPDQQLASFFDNFSPTILGHENLLPSTVRSAMLQVVFDRANLSSPSVSDAVVSLWLQDRLRPLLVNMAPYHVTPYFNILAGRNCSVEQQGVKLLNLTISSLSNDTQTGIQNQIIQSLKGPSPLRCYGDNYSNSFYSFLRSSFLGFQFPSLTTFLSLMPPDRKQQLINSMPPSDLGDFLRHTNVVGQESQLCQLYSSYLQIPVFLETESLPEQVRQRTLPCVWPIALRSSSRSEVNAWFDRGLPNYLVFLTKTQISQITSINASCLAFQKIVSALGSYNYSVADFTNQDVYNTIKVYLSSATAPKCYNRNDAELNSTAWFAEYIGPFISYLTVKDLESFGSKQDLQLFTVNPQNIALLNQSDVDLNLISYYTQLVYQQDRHFNPLLLPSLGQCFAPGPVFTQLTALESIAVLENVNRVCTDLDPQIAAALASNFGKHVDAKVIAALGNQCFSLSLGQIKSIKPSDLVDSLHILSNVHYWSEGQAKAIVQSLLFSGMIQINSSSSFENLGSLLIGLPTDVFSSISGSELVTASKNPSVMAQLASAPQVVQQAFIAQILSLDPNNVNLLENVPDKFVAEISRIFLLDFTNDSSTIIKLNDKKWTPQQVELFFDKMSTESAMAVLGGPHNLSSSVLQGFTCTGVRSLGTEQIKGLIKACRREGKDKVTLEETQLTCMYNHIREESDSTNFSLYPPDVLLYYDYSLVPQNSCRSYFQEMAHADFSVFSPVLSYKQATLFNNAKSCLGITSTSLTEDNVSVLGNMCCILDGSYIQNSHPSILEQLKNCPDLTVGQSAAVESLLTNGNTPYGVPSTWSEQTLKDLGMLTLHLPSSFYQRFDQDTKHNFLKYFLKVFGEVSREQRRQLKNEIRQSIKSDSEQTAECTVGIITQVTISDPTFPLDYNINQFNNCLSVSTVKDNLDAITEKVDEVEYLRIVLQKLQEADNSIIPEDEVQVLKAASRVATLEDIQLWTITQVDTLAALMDSSNGNWDPSLAKAIISKYLAVQGNTLGGAELNVIGGQNLCSLDVNDIKTISSQSLKEAKALDVSSCTPEKKKELYNIATEAFHTSPVSVTSYQLTQPYIGGADVNYVRGLVASNVNMDLATFSGLNENVVLGLTVNEVKGLLGANLPDLKSYENQALVQTWIRNQYQSQLDILGLGILGGKPDPTTPPVNPVYNSSTTSPHTSFTTLDSTSRQCQVAVANESNTCHGVNSAELQLQLNNGQMSGRFCDFSVEQFACASLSALTAQDLAVILKCDRSSSSTGSIPFWKLLLCKTSNMLDEALDLLATTTITPNPSVSMILDSIQEIRPDLLSYNTLNDPSMLQLWFNGRLRPFLPAVSSNFLSILATKEMQCSSYQNILQSLSQVQTQMSQPTQSMVYTFFIKPFLSRTDTAGCVSNISADWLRSNLGSFSDFASVSELFDLNPQFNPMEALSILSPKQSAELLVLKYPTLPNTDVIINKLFDYFTESPRERKFTEFLSFLIVSLNKGNLICSSYKTLFTRLDFMEATASLDVASFITNTRANVSQNIPLGCIIYGGQCNAIMANESSICIGINSTGLQLQLNSGKMSGRFCDFSVEELACASLSGITSRDLAEIMKCNRLSSSSGSTQVWKLLLSKTSGVLDNALDLLANTTIDPNSPSASMILDSIQEIRLDLLSNNTLNNPSTLQLWFNSRLRPFLPAVSSNFLSCLAAKNLQCSSYQNILKILSQVQPQMSLSKQVPVYTHFIKIYLSRNNTADPGCISNITSSTQWLQNNVRGFSVFLSIKNIKELYPQFSAMEALSVLSVRQLAEVASTPGQLTSADQVTMLMNYVPDQQLASFFDNFSPTILGRENLLPSTVRSAMLQIVFDRANLSSPSVSDAVVSLWLQDRLSPLLVNMAPYHVTPYFNILAGRNCSVEQQGVKLLNLIISSLSNDTQTGVQNQIIQSLKGPSPLRCYGDNYSYSFYSFLRSSFMGFQFPNLTTFLSLMPPDRKQQLINSMPPLDLGDLLRHTDVVGQESQLCQLYSSYLQIPVFLETESLPEQVRQRTLPCVWPMALRSSSRSEVNAWFDRGLPNYLVFLTKTQISQITSINASCLAFQKIVSALGSYNYSVADFTNQDVYNTIKVYLSSGTVPRCYSSNNPELNSTAWFAEYIGSFITFLTVADFQSLGSDQDLQLFTVNPQNLALLNQSDVDLNLISYYIQLVYQQDINFSPLLLPSLGQCFAPGSAFTQLTAQESIAVLENVKRVCTDLDPQISAALASNFGENIDATAISAMGNESTSLSIGQIRTIKPLDLLNSLSILSSVIGWREGQAKLIIEILMTSGMKVNSSSSLATLGSLVMGLPSSMFSSISGSELITASKNPSTLMYLMSAPQIVLQAFIAQIVSLDTNSVKIIENVPDELATEIPRVYLQQFTSDNSTIFRLNKKTWKRQQVELFFDLIAAESSTAVLGGPNNLSSTVLQGFTCTGVGLFGKGQINKLVKACRRKGTKKVTLAETQLTCMYNHIRGESDVTSFSLYPPNVLLYYDYSLVPQSSCRSYFQELADADFSVFSSVLSYKQTALFNNARSCLGITNTSLNADQVSVLGNMCCMLDGSYIQNSDPSILEKLKNCPDLTAAQAAAVVTLLTNGNTKYGASSSWNGQTLTDLGMLPLYLPSTFYNNFDKKTKRSFLKYFLNVLKTNGVSRQKRRNLKAEIRKSIQSKSKRAADCTVGTISQVTISDTTFPFDYDVNQFNNCLTAKTVKDNFDSITAKVDEVEYLQIVLQKLREAYNSIIPEDQVQALGPASRVATTADISSWTITQVDTLSALMNSSNGDWDPNLAKTIISKYLAVTGNTIGRAELNAIGGSNLCSLDVSVIKTISRQSLKEADALNVTSCTTEKKQELFNIAAQSFRSITRTSPSYLLTQPYLGGANITYIRSLVTSNVNMDLATFSNLNQNVVLSLTVSEVKNLLGTNLPDLKSYENQTLVQTWIRSQLQSELNTLGLNLSGGRADPVTAATSSAATATTTTTSTTKTTSSTTKGSGVRIQADAGFSFLVCLALLITSQWITI